jgi:hypothetical protein
MKILKYMLLAITGSLIFIACKDADFFNLTRDNPLDGKNDAEMKDGVNLKFGKYKVVSDNNSDSIINKGETVKLQVYIKNTGTSTAKSVQATFSTNSSYISGFTPMEAVSYGEIPPIAETGYVYGVRNGYAISFTVSDTTPADTKIPISINIVDENNNVWTSSFNVTVSAISANITYNNYSVVSDNNGDGIVNKGEAVSLNVSLKNTGTSAAKSVKATFSTTSPYVSAFTPTTQLNYGNISADGTVWKDNYSYSNGYAIKFTVSNEVLQGIKKLLSEQS